MPTRSNMQSSNNYNAATDRRRNYHPNRNQPRNFQQEDFHDDYSQDMDEEQQPRFNNRNRNRSNNRPNNQNGPQNNQPRNNNRRGRQQENRNNFQQRNNDNSIAHSLSVVEEAAHKPINYHAFVEISRTAYSAVVGSPDVAAQYNRFEFVRTTYVTDEQYQQILAILNQNQNFTYTFPTNQQENVQ